MRTFLGVFVAMNAVADFVMQAAANSQVEKRLSLTDAVVTDPADPSASWEVVSYRGVARGSTKTLESVLLQPSRTFVLVSVVNDDPTRQIHASRLWVDW